MAIRSAQAEWTGDLKAGKGTMKFGGGAFVGQYSFASRFEEGVGTNPEELIAAAHAGCFSMAFANKLASAGHTPTRVSTTSKVHLTKGDAGFGISLIELECDAQVPGIDEAQFQSIADDAKKTCPVSRVLTGTEISLKARLV